MSGNYHHTEPVELPAGSGAPAQEAENFPPPPPGPPPGHAQDSKAEQFPPPPPGPPPSHAARPQHPNETPIPDYNIPAYNPSHPQFAPPPTRPDEDESSLYDEPPPPKPHAATAAGGDGSSEATTAAAGKSSWTSKFSGWGTKAAAPFNMLANKLGSEAFLPTTMDKECEKAARILKSFCKDGIYTDVAPVTESGSEKAAPPPATDAPALSAAPTTAVGAAMAANAANAVNDANAGPSGTAATKQQQKAKSRTLLTIPSKVISRAAGLAIFTTARAGFHVSGATGSGIIVARLPDGRWSPPSGITVHSLGAGLMIGLDIYDCVVVINTPEALKAFTSTRVSLGTDLAVAAGPWGAGGAVDFAAPSRDRSKSREGRGKDADEVRPNLPPRPVSTERGTEQTTAPQATTGVESGATPATSSPGAGAPPVVVPDTETTTGAGRPTSSSERKSSTLKTAITKPVYSYVKSRGFYAGVQVDGTVFAERKDANAAFYGRPVSVEQILHGDVPSQGPAGQGWPHGAQGLFDVLRGAEGWRGQQQGQQQTRPQNLGVPSATAGMRDMSLDSAGGHGTGGTAGHVGPAAQAKAAEAAAEARTHPDPTAAGPPPPVYSEPTGAGTGAGGASDDIPPAYVDEGQARPAAGDAKSGWH